MQGCYLSINHKMSCLWNDQLDLHVIWWFLVLCGAGLKESSRMSHADSALLAEIMDEARRQVGVVYSQDSQWAFSCSYHHLYNRSIKVSGAPTAALLYWFNHKIKSQLLFCWHHVCFCFHSSHLHMKLDHSVRFLYNKPPPCLDKDYKVLLHIL